MWSTARALGRRIVPQRGDATGGVGQHRLVAFDQDRDAGPVEHGGDQDQAAPRRIDAFAELLVQDQGTILPFQHGVQVGEEQLGAPQRQLSRTVGDVGFVELADARPVRLDRQLPVLAHLLDQPGQERSRVFEDVHRERADRRSLERSDHVLQLATHLIGVGATHVLELVLELGERRLRRRGEEVGNVGMSVIFDRSRMGLYKLMPSSQMGENANRVSARSSPESRIEMAIAFGLA